MKRIKTLIGAALLAPAPRLRPPIWQGPHHHHLAVPARRGTDTLTRMIGSAIAEETGWNIVENKPGAGGNLLDATARAQPDGHTLVMAQTDNIVLNPWLYNKLSYDTFRTSSPSARSRLSPSLFVVLPESPYQSIADVVKTAKAKPNFISLGMPAWAARRPSLATCGARPPASS